jgi:hypothetical protein
MKRLLLVCLCGLALMTTSDAQQASKPDRFTFHQHIPLAAIPTMSTAALASSTGVTVMSLWLSNTNLSTIVTVTITCTTSGNAFVTAAIPGVTAGGNNIPVQLPADGLYCAGGVTWIASAAGVNGTISGAY